MLFHRLVALLHVTMVVNKEAILVEEAEAVVIQLHDQLPMLRNREIASCRVLQQLPRPRRLPLHPYG